MTNAPILAAEFWTLTRSRRCHHDTLTILHIDPETGQRTQVSRHVVHGKRDARRLAAELGAKPWNF